MKVTITRVKKIALVLAGVMIAATLLIASAPARATADDDTGGLFKAKCAMCHGQTAEKKFDAAKGDDDLIQVVLKGKQAEKPPNRPAFADRGITADQAKALVGFMKSQKH
ncbi:MAG TPA: cytochrome c [Pyrinomonadaceae bacterium]|nr:cytochrome c [Pyrinomonadaceae bacterium]